ncbi:MAG: Spy/CpxP family protein refolding chaperone [Phycisphaerae bacterium]
MKTTSKLFMAAILGTVMAFPAALARAEAPTTAPAPAAHHEGPMQRLFAGLNLTADQKAKLKEIVQPFHEKLAAWRQQNKAQLEALRDQIKAAREAHDKDKLKAAFQQLKTLRESAPKFKDILPQIKAILTPDQVKILDERIEKLRDRLEDARERRHPEAGATTAPAK